jgi:hypothetical protein
MRSGGMRHSGFSKSSSFQFACHSSPGRTNTSGANFNAARVTKLPS